MSSSSSQAKEPPGTFLIDGVDEAEKCFADIIDNPDNGTADVTFVVGGSKFGGLRSILSARCDVLKSMFNSGFKEGCSGEEVFLPQFSHAIQAFRAFLMYMHCHRASFDELPTNLHEIAKYFGAEELKAKCEHILKNASVNLQSALALLRFAELNDLSSQKRCEIREFTFAHANELLANPVEAVAQLSPKFIHELLERDRVDVSETLLFQIVLATPPEQQQKLLPLIRLPVMPTADIMNIVVPSNLVDNVTIMNALAFQADPKSVALPTHHNARKRKYLPPPEQFSLAMGPYRREFAERRTRRARFA